MTFKADRNGDWQLTGIRDTDDGVAVNQVAATTFVAAPKTAADDAPPSATRSVTTWPAPAKPKNLSASGYDYKAMAAYAAKYWNNYNPAYPNFNGQLRAALHQLRQPVPESRRLEARPRLHGRLPQVVRQLRHPVGLVRRRQRVLVVRPVLQAGHQPRQRLPVGRG